MNNKPVVIFERLKQVTQSQNEYWSARKLAKALDYSDYRNFETVVKKAKKSCKNSGQPAKNHFVTVTEMVTIGSGAQRLVDDILLTRYACYLVMQNADPALRLVEKSEKLLENWVDQCRRNYQFQELLPKPKSGSKIFLRKKCSKQEKNDFILDL